MQVLEEVPTRIRETRWGLFVSRIHSDQKNGSFPEFLSGNLDSGGSIYKTSKVVTISSTSPL